MVLKEFDRNILTKNLFNKTDKLLVAFSGGIDSVVLCDLLFKSGYNFELAHCNFQLRGKEANDDTAFCEAYAKSINKKCHTIYFNTKEYAAQKKLSIQMAARELRYNWFTELIEKHDYTYLLTAHHANDNAETLFVNLTRGTGIKGLQGIPEKQNNVVRPLLFATKQEIINYANKSELKYREDSSNQEIKYKRNFIRHQIIPELKKLNPTLEDTLNTSIHYFKQSAQIVTQFCELKFNEMCEEENNILKINISSLLNEAQKETLLFEWLNPKNFNTSQIRQLSALLTEGNIIGKQFESTTHNLVVDRLDIIIKEKNREISINEFQINSLTETNHLPFTLILEAINKVEFTQNRNEIVITLTDKLFPLTLRKWKIGDKFKPFGMSGFKKISDYFKDQKLSKFEKEDVWILESNKQIVWLVGYRMDDRFKITNESVKTLHIKAIFD